MGGYFGDTALIFNAPCPPEQMGDMISTTLRVEIVLPICVTADLPNADPREREMR